MKNTALKKVPTIASFAWLGYWLIGVLMFSNTQQPQAAAWAATINVGMQAIIVYSNTLVLIPSFLEKRRYILYGLLCFGMLVLLSKLQLTLVPADVKMILKRNIQYPRAFQFARIYLLFMVVLIISTAWKFAVDRFNALQTQNEMARKQLESELQFLKNQINPHFLFNTLNNIYTLAYLKEDNAAPMIMKLSELLRYMLYQCRAQWVPLPDEVVFLRNILEMQKLKSEVYGRQTTFEVTGVRSGQLIAPLLLLTFLENSFKHSDLDMNPHGHISVSLQVDDRNRLSFLCINTKNAAISAESELGGIGLANVKKRLELTYPGRHTLEVTDNTRTFEIRLTVSL
ncbi:sensor histidine kinase [Dyadobacter sp. BHUBP1]|uniref:sensor histidine kinase n=1 Tax=Dyadobacter sp. BHUBP1 TaxID=3424178 RepID=UPI003D355364